LRVVFREEALGCRHDGNGTAECVGEPDGFLLRTHCTELAANQALLDELS
jgi:hypothetical protein